MGEQDLNEKNFRKLVKRKKRQEKRKLRKKEFKKKLFSIKTKVFSIAGKSVVFVFSFVFQKEIILTLVIAVNTWAYHKDSKNLAQEIKEQRVEISQLQSKKEEKTGVQGFISTIGPGQWLNLGWTGYLLVNKVISGFKEKLTVAEMTRLYRTVSLGKAYIAEVEIALKEKKLELEKEREINRNLKEDLTIKLSNEKNSASEIENLKQTIQNKQKFLKQLESELLEKSDEIENLKAREKKIFTSLSSTAQKILEKYGLTSEIDYSELLENLDGELEKLYKELEVIKVEKEDLSEKLIEKDKVLLQLENLLKIKDQQILDVTLRLKDCQRRLKNESSNNSNLQKEINYLNSVLRDLTREKQAALRSSLSIKEKHAAVEKLTEQNLQQGSEMEGLRRDLISLNRQKKLTEEKVSELLKERYQLSNMNHNFKEALQEKNSELSKIKSLLNKEQINYENIRSENNELKNKIKNLERELNQKNQAYESVVDQTNLEKKLFESVEKRQNKKSKRPMKYFTGYDGQTNPTAGFKTTATSHIKWEDEAPSPKLGFWGKLKNIIRTND